MYEKLRQELSNFERVWKRVAPQQVKMPENIKLMRGKDKKDRRGKGPMLR